MRQTKIAEQRLNLAWKIESSEEIQVWYPVTPKKNPLLGE
jgi:hypothetical protein